MTRFLKYLGKRVLIMIPQMLGITLVSFLLVRLLPGNPATAMAGSLATPETVAAIEARLGLDQPLYIQFYMYVKNVLAGDLGTSWYTSNPVANDLAVRFPATLELITLSMFFAILVGVVGGSIAAIKPKGLVDRVTSGFATFAGAMPEFWIGLIFIYVFYVRLGIAAAPIGRLDLQFSSPLQVTGMILIDTLLTGNMAMFQSAVSHLILPVLTLSITLVGPILKMSRTSMRNALDSDYIYYARMCGMKQKHIVGYSFRTALPPIVTIIAVYYGFMLGGAVLVEKVFGWGGFGQYAVQSVINKDYFAIQGFLMLAAMFSLIIYLVVDIIYMIVDPRQRP